MHRIPYSSRTISKAISFIIILMLLPTGCGYRFAGGGSVPGGVKAVSITIFENRTAQTGLETMLTNDLIYEFTRAGAVTVRPTHTADAVVSGTIQRLQIVPIAHTGTTTTIQQRAVVATDIKMTATADNATIWERKGLSEEASFDVGATKSATNANLRGALEMISKKLAERVYTDMTADF